MRSTRGLLREWFARLLARVLERLARILPRIVRFGGLARAGRGNGGKPDRAQRVAWPTVVDDQPWQQEPEAQPDAIGELPDEDEIAAADAALDALVTTDLDEVVAVDEPGVPDDAGGEFDEPQVGSRPVERVDLAVLDASPADDDGAVDDAADGVVDDADDDGAVDDGAAPIGRVDGEAQPDPTESSSLDPDQIEADFAAVDAAIQRIDRGAYGRCEVCQVTLDDAVLQADPTASACPAHIHLRGGSSGDVAV